MKRELRRITALATEPYCLLKVKSPKTIPYEKEISKIVENMDGCADSFCKKCGKKKSKKSVLKLVAGIQDIFLASSSILD